MTRSFQYLKGYLYLGWLFWRQARFAKKLLHNVLINSKLEGDGTFSTEASRRLRYYGAMVPVVIGDTLNLLQGSPMTASTRYAVTLYGFFTPLFDDWFDTENPNAQKAAERVFRPETIGTQDDLHRVTRTVLTNLLDHAAAFAPNWKTPASDVIHAQIASLAQLSADTDITKIRQVTWLKGGASVLGIRHFLPTKISQPEHEVCVQLGGMMQYLDDIFDIYTDQQSGIRTIATECTDFFGLHDDYNRELKRLHFLLMQLPYPTRQKTKVWQLWELMWVRGNVCIEHLQRLEKKPLDTFTRQELVCDMATWRNIWRSWQIFRQSTY